MHPHPLKYTKII